MICAAKRLVCCTTARTVQRDSNGRGEAKGCCAFVAEFRCQRQGNDWFPARARPQDVVTINFVEGHEDAKLSAKKDENCRACFW
jgi:hypothetical protein